jgi:hypothetical protein
MFLPGACKARVGPLMPLASDFSFSIPDSAYLAFYAMLSLLDLIGVGLLVRAES